MTIYNAKYEKLRHQWAMTAYAAMANNSGTLTKEMSADKLKRAFEIADEALSISDDDFREVGP